MGLEVGPPWLVVAVDDEAGPVVIYRDNFTGAGFERVRKVCRDEPGSFSAVVGRSGDFARHGDGQLFDPIQEMRGRNYGTPADRGHRALIVAQGLLGDDHNPYSPIPSPQSMLKTFGITLGVILFLAMLGSCN